MTCSLTLGASTGKPPAHGSWRPPPAPPAPGAVVKEVVRAVSLGQESQQCWVVRTRRFFMGVDGAQQWKAESPIATRPCKAHPGLNQGAGSWYPRGAPHSPSSLKPPPDSAAPEIFPVQKASVFISCPAACPSPVFLYQILDQDPHLSRASSLLSTDSHLWGNTNARAGVSRPIPFSKGRPKHTPAKPTSATLPR